LFEEIANTSKVTMLFESALRRLAVMDNEEEIKIVSIWFSYKTRWNLYAFD
jgi:hypothetical protein